MQVLVFGLLGKAAAIVPEHGHHCKRPVTGIEMSLNIYCVATVSYQWLAEGLMDAD